MKIENIDPAALTPHPQNSRKHSDEQIDQLAASIERFGFNGSIIIAATCPNEPQARIVESRHCHQHLATIYNLHDPAKGASSLRAGATEAVAS